MSPKKFGWADDIVAPRQEINTLSLLYEEKAIQEDLPEGLTPHSFLEAYRAARKVYRDGSPPASPDHAETVDLTQKVSVFGAKASARARRDPRERGMITCVCPDRPGVLATLAEMVAKEGGNIEGAMMSIVAGHLVTVLIVSGAAGIGRDSAVDGNPDLRVGYLDVTAADADWPLPGSSWWHARARGTADASPLLSLTGALAKRGFPLITMSSWFESPSTGGEETEVVDLNFAVMPNLTNGEVQTIREIESELAGGAGDVQVDFLPAEWPTQHRSVGDVGSTDQRDVVITVEGQAEPGFVHAVLDTLLEDVSGAARIRGASMAILDGMTVVTVVVKAVKKTTVSELSRQVRRQVSHGLESTDSAAHSAPVQLVATGPSRKGKKPKASRSSVREPTHELSMQVPEQSRVVLKVARLLADRGVNITWFVSHVRDPSVGERWPICDIQMHLHVKKGAEDEVDSELRSLAEREGWEGVRLDKWSVSR